MSNYDFSTDIAVRLAAMEEAQNPDDIPFLVAAVRHWMTVADEAVAAERERCVQIVARQARICSDRMPCPTPADWLGFAINDLLGGITGQINRPA